MRDERRLEGAKCRFGEDDGYISEVACDACGCDGIGPDTEC